MATSTISTTPATRRADRARRSHSFPIRAALLTPDVRGRWGTVCCHGYREAWPSERLARIALCHAADWCDQCAAECDAGV